MATESDDSGLARPTFRGCVVCYSAEWAYYGAKRAAKAVSATTD